MLTIVHDDATVTASSRILVPGNANGTLSGLRVQIFRVRVDLGGGYVWRNLVNLRPLTTAIVGFTSSNAAHWAGSPPVTAQATLDRLAAQVYALGGNTPIS